MSPRLVVYESSHIRLRLEHSGLIYDPTNFNELKGLFLRHFFSGLQVTNIKTTTMFWVFNLNSLRSENSIVIPQKLLQNLQFLFYRCLVSELQRNPSLGGKTRIGTDKLATYFVRASHPVQGTRLFWGLKIPSQKLCVTGNVPRFTMGTCTNFTQYREAHPICIYYLLVLLSADRVGYLGKPCIVRCALDNWLAIRGKKAKQLSFGSKWSGHAI